MQKEEKGPNYMYYNFHLAKAACTRFVISSLACFFASSVIPSNVSSSSGVVNKGSNSKIKPSFVGTLISADGLDADPNPSIVEEADVSDVAVVDVDVAEVDVDVEAVVNVDDADPELE